jgi:hypothetical protein
MIIAKSTTYHPDGSRDLAYVKCIPEDLKILILPTSMVAILIGGKRNGGFA